MVFMGRVEFVRRVTKFEHELMGNFDLFQEVYGSYKSKLLSLKGQSSTFSSILEKHKVT